MAAATLAAAATTAGVMKRLHRRWHRLIWCLLSPTLAAALLLGLWLRPPAVVNPVLPPALQSAAADNPAPGAAPIGKPR
jgi:hypothetical protein